METPDNREKNRPGNDPKQRSAPAIWMGLALPMGIAPGAAMGAATNDIGTWVAIGVAIGAAVGGIGTAVQAKRNKEK